MQRGKLQFRQMNRTQLREFISGCHDSGDYSCDFEEAELEFSNRYDWENI